MWISGKRVFWQKKASAKALRSEQAWCVRPTTRKLIRFDGIEPGGEGQAHGQGGKQEPATCVLIRLAG